MQRRQYYRANGGSRARSIERRLAAQGYRCPLCRNGFDRRSRIALHHPTGFVLDEGNVVLLHAKCHRRLHALGGIWLALTRREPQFGNPMSLRVRRLHSVVLPAMRERWAKRPRCRASPRLVEGARQMLARERSRWNAHARLYTARWRKRKLNRKDAKKKYEG